jgi:Flp pilus assembly protein TadG
MHMPPQSRMCGMPRSRREGGATLVLVALATIALIAFVGLALDLGKLYVTKSELQNSADACALAAIRDLDGITPLAVSEAAGIAAGHINRALFQSAPVSMTVNSSVTYATSSSGPFQDKNTVSGSLATISYVQCKTSVTGIANWLIQVLNLLPGVHVGPASVSATAAASIGHAQSTCAIPIFICDPSRFTPASSYTIGQWLVGKGDTTTGTYNQGDFGWANLNSCNGASCLSDQLTGSTCNLPAINQQVRANGNIASLDNAYNTRFGIQNNGNGAATGQSDFTGWAYTTWNSAGSNVFSDFLAKRGSRTPYQGDNVLSTQGNNFKTSGQAGSSAVYQAGGDRRLGVAPMVDCNTVASSTGATVTNWACVLLLDPMQQGGNIDAVHFEYRGLASVAGSPCATQGVPGAVSTGPLVPQLIQ